MRLLLRFAVTIALAGVCGFALVLLAPGFGVDERELDPNSHAGSITKDVHALSIPELARRSAVALMSGDWGMSETFQYPVRTLIAERWSTTAASVAAGLAFAWTTALLWGGAGSLWNWSGWAGSVASFSLLALPQGLIAVAVFLAGAPVAAGIALAVFPHVYRFVRELTQTSWTHPCILAAAARGSGRVRLLVREVGPLISRPLLSVLGTSVATAIGASIPMESLCDSPGLGQLAFRACMARDLALLLPLILLVTACVQGANAFAEAFADKAAM